VLYLPNETPSIDLTSYVMEKERKREKERKKERKRKRERKGRSWSKRLEEISTF